jgi:hypothetical protein
VALLSHWSTAQLDWRGRRVLDKGADLWSRHWLLDPRLCLEAWPRVLLTHTECKKVDLILSWLLPTRYFQWSRMVLHRLDLDRRIQDSASLTSGGIYCDACCVLLGARKIKIKKAA